MCWNQKLTSVCIGVDLKLRVPHTLQQLDSLQRVTTIWSIRTIMTSAEIHNVKLCTVMCLIKRYLMAPL